jgi:hypothetical protein
MQFGFVAPAMPLSPRTPAISPMIRKVMLQLSESSFSFLRDRTAKFRLNTNLFTVACDSGLRRPLIMLASAKTQQRLRIALTLGAYSEADLPMYDGYSL